MICLHCRVSAREVTIAAIIARIGLDYTHADLIVWKKLIVLSHAV